MQSTELLSWHCQSFHVQLGFLNVNLHLILNTFSFFFFLLIYVFNSWSHINQNPQIYNLVSGFTDPRLFINFLIYKQ